MRPRYSTVHAAMTCFTCSQIPVLIHPPYVYICTEYREFFGAAEKVYGSIQARRPQEHAGNGGGGLAGSGLTHPRREGHNASRVLLHHTHQVTGCGAKPVKQTCPAR
ncbi:hypothetical protein E2C01_065908 [Portunus trituberculatus]|uniref:Uncharacterized protein n=1 Tax=Portunus trituberculatus TaxID=210409 RepID=A0A5B7HT45_PORTR|nr:hypothetical protein [Portunus trituberculatus]